MRKLVKRLARALDLEIRRTSVETCEPMRIVSLLAYYGVDLVLDVGANIGQYGQMLRQAGYRGRIVSFEPLASAHAELCRLAARDAGWIVAPPVALGDNEGIVDVNVADNLVSSSILPMRSSHLDAAPQSKYVATERVRMARLDDVACAYINDARMTYLKIDTQGFESRVVDGASGIIDRLRGIQLELSLMPLYDGSPLMSEMVRRMEMMGYELHAVLPGFTDLATGRMLQADGIFYSNRAARRPMQGLVHAAGSARLSQHSLN